MRQFMTTNLALAAFSPKNLYGRLKFCMQPTIVVIYTDSTNPNCEFRTHTKT